MDLITMAEEQAEKVTAPEATAGLSQDAVFAHFLKADTPVETDTKETTEETPTKPEETETPVETPKEAPETQTPDEPEPTPDENEQSEEDEAPHDKHVLSQLSEEQQVAVKAWNTEIVEKRVGKITSQKKAIEEKLAAVEAEKAQLAEQYQAQYEQLEQNLKSSQPVPAFAENDPMAEIKTSAELAKARKQALEVKHWAEEALDSDEDAIESNGREYSRGDVKKIMRSAARDLEENLPAREKWIEMKASFDKSTEQTFPWAKNPNSEESMLLKAEMAKSPVFAKDPRAKWIMALALEQARTMNQKAQEAKNGSDKKPKVIERPPPASVSTVVPAKRPSASSTSEKLRQHRQVVTSKNASRDDVYQLMLAQEQAKAAG